MGKIRVIFEEADNWKFPASNKSQGPGIERGEEHILESRGLVDESSRQQDIWWVKELCGETVGFSDWELVSMREAGQVSWIQIDQQAA